MSDLAGLLRDRLGECTPAERKVVRVLLAGFPVSGLQTATALAAQAGVSAPTVVRLVARLGFAGYPDFQQRVRDELAGRGASPVALYESGEFATAGGAGLDTLAARTADAVSEAVHQTFTAVPTSELDTAISLLADPRRRIHIHGGRFSALFGTYLGLHLMQLRDAVTPLPATPVVRAATLADLGRRDVLVILDYRRYEPASLRIAQLARERDASVVLFTDPWLSPISAIAQVVLPTRVDSLSPYDSMVPVTALIEAIVTGVLGRLGPSARDRMHRIEDSAQRWNLYLDE